MKSKILTFCICDHGSVSPFLKLYNIIDSKLMALYITQLSCIINIFKSVTSLLQKSRFGRHTLTCHHIATDRMSVPQYVTGFAKRDLPHTSNLLTLMISNFRLEKATDLIYGQ